MRNTQEDFYFNLVLSMLASELYFGQNLATKLVVALGYKLI